MKNLKPQYAHLNREQKAELYSLKMERLKRDRRKAARASYREYIKQFSTEPPPARHHDVVIDALQQVAQRKINRLMIFMPPGSAKSTYTSIQFPPWWIQRNPSKLIIGASHTEELAEHFGRKVRNIVASDEYLDSFNVTLKRDNKAAGRWETTNRASYYAVGVRGSVTGRRGDLGLIDDPVKGRKEAESESIQNDVFEWYKSDFRTRLKPGAAIILMMTRWVENDLAGRILPEDYSGESGPVIAQDGECWNVINLPMEAREHDIMGREVGELLWPEWFDADFVAQEKRSQGPRNWASLYQQDPTPDTGAYYKREDFRFYDTKPKHLALYMAGDWAVGEDAEHDFSEMGIFGVDPADDVYLVDWFREKVDSLALVDAILDMVKLHEPRVLIGEKGVIRKAIEPILKRRMRERSIYVPIEWLTHSDGDKAAMGRSFQALVQQNRIYLPAGKDWAENLLSQLTKFPAGRFDDGADVCALFGRHINKVWAAKAPQEPEGERKITGRKPIAMKALTMADFED